jgi:hypothetical protein
MAVNPVSNGDCANAIAGVMRRSASAAVWRVHFGRNAGANGRAIWVRNSRGMITSGSNDSIAAFGAKVAPSRLAVQDFSDPC